jgi:uncharacterized protein YecE (DUF72 family)
MEFGRVPELELNKVDFSLPEEPAINKKILSRHPVNDPKIYVGCAKWGRTEWVGKIYPPKTKERNFLDRYVEHYNSIELNAVHHKLYGERAILKWAEKAKGRDFLFCPKVYKGLTHSGKLDSRKFLFNEFFRGIRAFGKHLGPVFVQVNEKFSPKRKEELFTFLTALPKDIQFFLEVRHPAWLANEKQKTELFSFLKDHSIGAVITDTAGRRDCAHMHLTIPKTFIRFVGNSLHKTDYTRTNKWVDRMKYWLDDGLQELYFFMHMHDESTSPELTVYLIERMNKMLGLDLLIPKFIDQSLLKKGKKA